MIYFMQVAPGFPVLIGTADRIALTLDNRAGRHLPGVGRKVRRRRQSPYRVIAQMEGGVDEARGIYQRFAHLRWPAHEPEPGRDMDWEPGGDMELRHTFAGTAHALTNEILFRDEPELMEFIAAAGRAWDGEDAASLGVERPRIEEAPPARPVDMKARLRRRG